MHLTDFIVIIVNVNQARVWMLILLFTLVSINCLLQRDSRLKIAVYVATLLSTIKPLYTAIIFFLSFCLFLFVCQESMTIPAKNPKLFWKQLVGGNTQPRNNISGVLENKLYILILCNFLWYFDDLSARSAAANPAEHLCTNKQNQIMLHFAWPNPEYSCGLLRLCIAGWWWHIWYLVEENS